MTTKILIGFAVVVFIIIATASSTKKSNTEKSQYNSSHPWTVDKIVPDSAVSFGYKCMWFAVKTEEKNKIAEILKLRSISDCNWKVGTEKAYKGYVFITPPIDGWTLACGWGLPHGDTKAGIMEIEEILKTLSNQFGEAQFFCTHRVTEYHCWMKAIGGQIERVYSYSGESGENLAIEGNPTTFESTINLINTFSEEAKKENYFERDDIIRPDESLVMKVAKSWSVDPSQLETRKDISPSLGLIGQR